jgi:hypothetical protein
VDECEWERRVSKDVAKAFWESLGGWSACNVQSDGRNAQVIAQQPIAAAAMRMTRSERIHPGKRVRSGLGGCKEAKVVLTSK